MTAKRKIKMALYASRVSIILKELDDFYEPRDALQWLLESQPCLEGQVPADLITEDGGMVRVTAVIKRLQDGAYI